MGNTQHNFQNVLLLGLSKTGKTLLSSYLKEHVVIDSFYEQTTISECKLTFARRPLRLIELGGGFICRWPEMYSEYVSTQYGAIDIVYIFISSKASIPEIHLTRSSLMMMYYHFEHLLKVPLCVIQTCISSDEVPIVDWQTIKKELQLDYIHRTNKNVLIIRVVFDEMDCLRKNLERMLEWTFFQQCQKKQRLSYFLMDIKKTKKKI